MVFDEYFLIIPVYRIKEDKYYSSMEDDFENSLPKNWYEDFKKNNLNLVEGLQSHHHASYGGVWEFNEIVGYIKLYFLGTQVRGEYWATIPKRKVRTRRKQFEYKSLKLAAEVEIRKQTQSGILEAVEEYIDRCQKKIKNRHIDLREFNKLKSHIDWSSLYKANNPFLKKDLKVGS